MRTWNANAGPPRATCLFELGFRQQIEFLRISCEGHRQLGLPSASNRRYSEPSKFIQYSLHDGLNGGGVPVQIQQLALRSGGSKSTPF